MEKKRKWIVTTGQVASAMGLSGRTICKMYDRGDLPGFRIPGSNDRRIYLDHLLEYAEKKGIRLDRQALGIEQGKSVEDRIIERLEKFAEHLEEKEAGS